MPTDRPSAPGVMKAALPPAGPHPRPCQGPQEDSVEGKECPSSPAHLPPQAGAQLAVAAFSGTTNTPGAGQRGSLLPHAALLSPKAAPTGGIHAKDPALRISPPGQVPPGSRPQSPAGPQGLPAIGQQDDQDSLEEGEEAWAGAHPEPGKGGGGKGVRHSRKQRPPHTSCPQARCGLQAPAITRTAMGSQRSRSSQGRRLRSAQPRCPCQGVGVPWVSASRLSLRPRPSPKAPAGGGSEETSSKAKQSRSEKKARKVGCGRLHRDPQSQN